MITKSELVIGSASSPFVTDTYRLTSDVSNSDKCPVCFKPIKEKEAEVFEHRYGVTHPTHYPSAGITTTSIRRHFVSDLGGACGVKDTAKKQEKKGKSS